MFIWANVSKTWRDGTYRMLKKLSIFISNLLQAFL